MKFQGEIILLHFGRLAGACLRSIQPPSQLVRHEIFHFLPFLPFLPFLSFHRHNNAARLASWRETANRAGTQRNKLTKL